MGKRTELIRGMRQIITKNSLGTKNFGKKMARDILNLSYPREGAFVLGLKGDLGGGKTTFVQGFAEGLGVREKILSPTFVILKKFKIRNLSPFPKKSYRRPNFKNFFHIDCYRIQEEKELLDLGFDKIILNPENVVVVEWGDRVKDIMPKDSVWLEFDFINQNTRAIKFKGEQKRQKD